jgi:hypothetical protein
MVTRRRRPSKQPGCARCENTDDLETIGGERYCLPCRTCPHGQTWWDTWVPACCECVLEAHTAQTPEGPRIKNVDAYLAEVVRLRVDTLTHTFDEREQIGDRARYGDGLGVEVDRPFHFMTPRK